MCLVVKGAYCGAKDCIVSGKYTLKVRNFLTLWCIASFDVCNNCMQFLFSVFVNVMYHYSIHSHRHLQVTVLTILSCSHLYVTV
jgi:hypothetical protein